MMRIFTTIVILLSAIDSMAQPASEIYLFDLSAKKNKVTISNPVNITNRKGYDNQPAFHPSESFLFYASFNDEGRSDIVSYNYKTKVTTKVTETTEREYSPTVTPDRAHLSCIIQRDNNAQDLGKYSITGGKPDVLIDNLIVGYHAWADNSHVALFVLGTPNSLHYMRLPTKRDTVLAENIGRSLHKVPGQAAISFVHKVSEKEWLIKLINTATLDISTVGATLPGREDLCWLPDGRILMSDGENLFYLTPGPREEWKRVNTVNASMLKAVTRLAVSANGKKIAIVVAEE